MKKLLVSLLIGAMAFSVGCGEKVDYEANEIKLDKAILEIAQISKNVGNSKVTEDNSIDELELLEIKEELHGLKFNDETYEYKYEVANKALEYGINGICEHDWDDDCEHENDFYIFLDVEYLLENLENGISPGTVYELDERGDIICEDDIITINFAGINGLPDNFKDYTKIKVKLGYIELNDDYGIEYEIAHLFEYEFLE